MKTDEQEYNELNQMMKDLALKLSNDLGAVVGRAVAIMRIGGLSQILIESIILAELSKILVEAAKLKPNQAIAFVNQSLKLKRKRG